MYRKIVVVFFSLLVLALSGLVSSLSELEKFFSSHSQERCSHQYQPKATRVDGKAASSLVHWVSCE